MINESLVGVPITDHGALYGGREGGFGGCGLRRRGGEDEGRVERTGGSDAGVLRSDVEDERCDVIAAEGVHDVWVGTVFG